MWTLVVLTLVSCACAVPFLQDTPEVVAERARFLQLYNAQAAAAAAAPDDPTSRWNAAPRQAPVSNYLDSGSHNLKWTGPVAATIPAGLPGAGAQVADTAEVAAARNAFLAAYRAQVTATTGQNVASHAPSHYQPEHTYAPVPQSINVIPVQGQKWTGPFAATLPAGVDGRITPVQDTAEVQAARNAFLNTYNAALTGAYTYQPVPQAQPAQQRWVGPVAATIPAGLPGSTAQVPQTADVAAATAAFHQAYNAAVAATTGRRF